MDYSVIVKTIVDNILLPILVVIGSSLLVIVKSYAQKITESVIAKNEIVSLGNISLIKNNLLSEISTIVQAAVCSHMTLAEGLKSDGTKLSYSDVIMLQNSAKQLIYQSLPSSLTDENGAMLKIIGGKDKLDAIISGVIEHAVIEVKSKMALSK